MSPLRHSIITSVGFRPTEVLESHNTGFVVNPSVRRRPSTMVARFAPVALRKVIWCIYSTHGDLHLVFQNQVTVTFIQVTNDLQRDLHYRALCLLYLSEHIEIENIRTFQDALEVKIINFGILPQRPPNDLKISFDLFIWHVFDLNDLGG